MHRCDICIKGPPERQNLKAEAMIILQVVATHCMNISYGGYEGRLGERPNIKGLVSRIRERYQQFSASDLLWWRGLARLWEVEGFIREGDDMNHVRCCSLAGSGNKYLESFLIFYYWSNEGFTSSFLLYLPILRRRQKKQIAEEKWRLITEALEQAEDRVLRYEERHDNILNQICSHYIVSREIVEALADAREAMNEALEFAITLRNLQLEIIRLYPDDYESASRHVWLIGKTRRQRNNNN
ncbi:hypothetical protein R3W88_002970 [Solanum pinnatisectum]|uniref:Uncharacterized protein n=1 Tax=Solanum pinnatisectum TaxID=50273 RepID=A0AAV9MNK1_9SOLN|nr:hypothetical protein R3W88_002970 [Solanum pinnatisectum]